MKAIDVIIPCYNSELTIRTVAEGIMRAVGQYEVRLLLVNDCSPDNVWVEIQSLCSEYSNVIGINLTRNFGQQAARMAALEYIVGDYVVFMDDDGQHDSEYISEMIKKLDEGYDIVYASFEKKKQAKWKTLGSNLNQKTAEWLEEKPRGVKTSSFFVMRKYIAEELKKYHSSSPIIFGYLMKTTQNIACITIPHRPRLCGKSSYNIRKLAKLWLNASTSFSTVPLRLSSYLGFGSAFVGLVTFVIIIIRKILHPQISAGYTSTIAIILFFAGVLLLMIGLIGEYLGKMFMTINSVPQYVVKEVIHNRNENL